MLISIKVLVGTPCLNWSLAEPKAVKKTFKKKIGWKNGKKREKRTCKHLVSLRLRLQIVISFCTMSFVKNYTFLMSFVIYTLSEFSFNIQRKKNMNKSPALHHCCVWIVSISRNCTGAKNSPHHSAVAYYLSADSFSVYGVSQNYVKMSAFVYQKIKK